MKRKKLIGLLAIPIVVGGVGFGAITTSQAHAAPVANQETQAGESGDTSEQGDRSDSLEKETPGKTDTDTNETETKN